jgi:hypothetical protein
MRKLISIKDMNHRFAIYTFECLKRGLHGLWGSGLLGVQRLRGLQWKNTVQQWKYDCV